MVWMIVGKQINGETPHLIHELRGDHAKIKGIKDVIGSRKNERSLPIPRAFFCLSVTTSFYLVPLGIR